MINIDNLAVGYRYTFNSMLRGKDFKGKINGSCNWTKKFIVVDLNGNCLLCPCDAWLPIPVGQAVDFDSIESVFNSPIAKTLQQDIDDRKFTWCAVTHCGVVNRDQYCNETTLSINIDESCNLACPSCRRDQIMHSTGTVFEEKSKVLLKTLEWLEKYQHPIHIIISGNGDCLASHIMRPLVRSYVPRPGQTFTLFTNGLLIKKILADAPMIDHVVNFKISVDAGSAEVYEQVRRPGKWDVLLDNLNWLDEHNYSSKVNLQFVLQHKNYKDLPAFVDLCQSRGYSANITQLADWATWTTSDNTIKDSFTIKNGTFADNNILNHLHPEYNECLEIIRTIKDKNLNKVMFAPLILKSIES